MNLSLVLNQCSVAGACDSGMTFLTSEIAITGKNRQNKQNSEVNKPKLPISIMMSIAVG